MYFTLIKMVLYHQHLMLITYKVIKNINTISDLSTYFDLL